jgi:hypothetical protein
VQIQEGIQEAGFSELNVTSIVPTSIRFQPRCANGFCENGEATRGSQTVCVEDCTSTNWCPAAAEETEIGTSNAVCAGLGTCKPMSRQCSCPVGHTGKACTRCEYGFAPRGMAHRLTFCRRCHFHLQVPSPDLHCPIVERLLILPWAHSYRVMQDPRCGAGRVCAPTRVRFDKGLGPPSTWTLLGMSAGTFVLVATVTGGVIIMVLVGLGAWCCLCARKSQVGMDPDSRNKNEATGISSLYLV